MYTLSRSEKKKRTILSRLRRCLPVASCKRPSPWQGWTFGVPLGRSLLGGRRSRTCLGQRSHVPALDSASALAFGRCLLPCRCRFVLSLLSEHDDFVSRPCCVSSRPQAGASGSEHPVLCEPRQGRAGQPRGVGSKGSRGSTDSVHS